MLKSGKKSLEAAQTALFIALIFLLAFIPGIGYIPLGVTRATIIHVPVIIGSIVLGSKIGAILGGVFGLTSFITNTLMPTLTSFVFTPFYEGAGVGGSLLSLVVCFVPRILTGIVPYYAFKALSKLLSRVKVKETISLIGAGILGSMTNTVLVMSMIYLFFGENYAAAKGISYDALLSVIIGIVGVNGIPEAVTAAILTCVVCKALFKIKKRQRA